MKKLLAFAGLALLLTGCSNLHSVVTTTQTGLGLAVSENPSTQLYEARMGFFRSEFAYVPGNTNQPGNVPDVIMENRFDNIFKGGSMYQRLAVGSNAVIQPGATALFTKDSTGSVNTNTVSNLLLLNASKSAK